MHNFKRDILHILQIFCVLFLPSFLLSHAKKPSAAGTKKKRSNDFCCEIVGPLGPPYVSPVEPFCYHFFFLFFPHTSPSPLSLSLQRIVQHHQKLHRGRCAGQWVACQLLHMFRACVPCDLCGSTNRALNGCPVAVILF